MQKMLTNLLLALYCCIYGNRNVLPSYIPYRFVSSSCTITQFVPSIISILCLRINSLDLSFNPKYDFPQSSLQKPICNKVVLYSATVVRYFPLFVIIIIAAAAIHTVAVERIGKRFSCTLLRSALPFRLSISISLAT